MRIHTFFIYLNCIYYGGVRGYRFRVPKEISTNFMEPEYIMRRGSERLPNRNRRMNILQTNRFQRPLPNINIIHLIQAPRENNYPPYRRQGNDFEYKIPSMNQGYQYSKRRRRPKKFLRQNRQNKTTTADITTATKESAGEEGPAKLEMFNSFIQNFTDKFCPQKESGNNSTSNNCNPTQPGGSSNIGALQKVLDLLQKGVRVEMDVNKPPNDPSYSWIQVKIPKNNNMAQNVLRSFIK